MSICAPRRRLSHLWQLPLLLVSAVLFAVSAGLFVNARPGLTFRQKLSTPREMLADGRPDAAVEALERLSAAEKFSPDQAARIHLLLAEALDASQNQKPQPLPATARRIVEETRIALAEGARPSGEIYRRLAHCQELLGQPVEAISLYRQAIAVDPARTLPLMRRVIALQVKQEQWGPAMASVKAFLASKQLTDSERAWGCRLKARLLSDRGQYADSRPLLEQSLRLDPDSIAQAESKYRLGLCAWKLGDADAARRLIRGAREVFKGQHPLDADAAMALGRIEAENNDAAGAIALFDEVVSRHPDSPVATQARLARGGLRIQAGDVSQGQADLEAVAQQAKSYSSDSALREDALAALRQSSSWLMTHDRCESAIALMLDEQLLEPRPVGSFYSRLAKAYERRAEQVDRSIADAPADQKIALAQNHRDLCLKAGDAEIAFSQALSAAGDASFGEPFLKALDLYDQSGQTQKSIAAMETFIAAHRSDPTSAGVLMRLGEAYQTSGQADQALGAYARVSDHYPASPDAPKAVIARALILEPQPGKAESARSLLAAVVDGKDIRHDSDEYRRALFELATLDCRLDQWKEALPRLDEFATKFSTDPRLGQAIFLLGECHRHAAQQIDAQLASASASAGGTGATVEMDRALADKMAQWRQAAQNYDRAAQLFTASPPTQPSDQRYQKLAGLRRADCDYEQGRYEDAVARYEQVASQYPDSGIALAATVQVVNACRAMNKAPEAQAAAQRARAMLKRMPRQAFEQGLAEMPRAYWEQWLKWTSADKSM